MADQFQLPEWAQWLSALGPSILGVAVLAVTARQWLTDVRRAKREVAQSVLPLYDALGMLSVSATRFGVLDKKDDVLPVLVQLHRAKHVLEPTTVEYVDNVCEVALATVELHKKLDQITDQHKRERLIDEIDEKLRYLRHILNSLDADFARYIDQRKL